ncbi:hypothetical protein LEMLEM_LOCUS16442, partial [Lemmus lemmus]
QGSSTGFFRKRKRKKRQTTVGLWEDPLRRSWLPAKRTGFGGSQAWPHLGPWDPALQISEIHVLQFDGSNRRRGERSHHQCPRLLTVCP